MGSATEVECILLIVIDKFREYPLYLALQPKDVQHFTAAHKAYQAIVERYELVLFQVSPWAKE
jgi:hypothetical protein